METAINEHKGVLVVRLDGRLDITHSASFEKKVVDEISSKPRDVVINLSKVTYMSSSGISSLLGIYRFCTARDRRMVICEASPVVLKLLDVVELGQVFKIHSREDEAINALAHG